MKSESASAPGGEVLDAIARRRSVRRFDDRHVDEDLIRLLLEAANSAPSAHNQQSWRFIIVRGERKAKLVDLIPARSADFPRPASVLLRMASRTIASAPVVIAIANSGELIRHGEELFSLHTGGIHDFFRTMEIQSSAAAVENLLLAATSLGLATVWLGILFLIKDDVLALLEEPKGEFMAVVPVGYPSGPTPAPRKRPLATVAKTLD
ncbi:MAG: nitroreductase [Candidatus Aminicenantes bacterium RBG_16_63_16]|nr:MAG: nitroreductase [Candidatus Aminicenantes bacterium RBG_16_63_16]